jgi:hypothetical protein
LIIAPGWTRFGFKHAHLAAMFAALILRTLQIAFFRSRSDPVFAFSRASSDNQLDSPPPGSTGGRQRKAASRTAQGGVSRAKSREWKLPIDKPAIAAAFPGATNLECQSRVPNPGVPKKPTLVGTPNPRRRF